MINMIVSQNSSLLGERYDSENITLPLDFMPDYTSSRLFANAPSEITDILANQPVTMNNHIRAVNDEDYEANPSLANFFRVISHNKDRKGKQFISTIEGKKYPFYGLQWHPEKPLFEWWSKEVIQHSPDATKAMQYMADFFISEAVKNDHAFPTAEDIYDHLIWNYSPLYSAAIVPGFVQVYVFDH
eukprot:TRINITY_DN605_c0_g1_i3.p1 TRINITY_DN605_c0_g1~~TRINITY_DN605_c0_g1_i3.p1  ORF type:complete len:186 (-),score=28.83 TRINITY_DN605_c0_g1_i3:39-596(-)